MAAGLFTITELRRVAGATGAPPDAERFEWSAGPTMPDDRRGGARAAPLGSWLLGIQINHVRTDYPGARSASLQVLSARRKAFTLTGKWDDRWNFPGYAVSEMTRMEAMVQRGNVCRFQFQQQTMDGLIVEFDPDYKGEWLVRYSITVEPIGRPADYQPNRSPPGPLTPVQRFDAAAVSIIALQEAADTVPASALGGTLADDVAGTVVDTVVARDQLGATLDQRDLRPNAQPAASLPRLATQFRQLGDSAQRVINSLVEVRADVDVITQTAADVLRFEDWSRSMRYNARLLLGRSLDGADDMQERAEPGAERLYRPNAGQSLYKISREVYGTPHGWRAIAERNGLASMTLTGEELLIIPERGRG
jgi:hypothetical protein